MSNATGTILLMRHVLDPVADEVATRLEPMVRVWFIEQWLASCRIYHSIGSAGAVTRIDDANGRRMFDAQVAVVLNRVRQVPAPMHQNATASDHAYVVSEATALLWSCLESLNCPILNSVTALKVVGRADHPFNWASVAVRAGLETREFRLTTATRLGSAKSMQAIETPFQTLPRPRCGWGWFGSVGTGRTGNLWIVGDTVLGSLEGVSAEKALRFAQMQGIGFGLLHFEEYADESWRLTGFDALPLWAPATVVRALVDLLAGHAHRHAMADAAS